MILIAAAYLIGFSIYQIFGVPHDVEWSIFFDCLHYGFAMGVFFNRAVYAYRYNAFYALLTSIIIIVILFQLTFLGESLEIYKEKSIVDEPFYFFPIVCIIILTTFIITKLKVKIK